jgi:hypothetical protein
MAKPADHEPSDLRTTIAQRLGKIADHGLSVPAVRQSGIPELLTPDWDLVESAQFIAELIARLANEIIDEKRLLAVLAALRIPPAPDRLGEKLMHAYTERASQWDHAAGLRQRIFESQQAWRLSSMRTQVHLTYRKSWSEMSQDDQRDVYLNLVKDYWYNGRDELADLLIAELQRASTKAALPKPTQPVEATPTSVLATEKPFNFPQQTTANSTPTTLVRPIPLSDVVEEALDAARSSCEARRRAFHNADLLLALLDIPSGYVAACFNAVRPNLANEARTFLTAWIAELARDQQRHPFQPFKWVEHPAVKQARDLVVTDGGDAINEVYLLLGVLSTKSNTRRQLGRYIDLDHLAREAHARRSAPDHTLMTSDPDNVTWPVGDDDDLSEGL